MRELVIIIASLWLVNAIADQGRAERPASEPPVAQAQVSTESADRAFQAMVDELNVLVPKLWGAFSAKDIPELSARGRQQVIVMVPGAYMPLEERSHVVLVFTNDRNRPPMAWERANEQYLRLGPSRFGYAHLFIADSFAHGNPAEGMFDWPEAAEFCAVYLNGDRERLEVLRRRDDDRYHARDGWGPSKNGLRARWLNYSEELVVGERVSVGLDVMNFGDDARAIPIRQAHPWRSWQVLGPDGQPVAFRAGARITSSEWLELKPRGSVSLFGGADLTQLFDLSRPGRYTLRFTGQAVRDVSGELELELREDQLLPRAPDWTFELAAP